MKFKTKAQTAVILIGSFLVLSCSSLNNITDMPKGQQGMTFGNSENVKVLKNPTMMFHNIVVNQTANGAELEGKVHIMSRQHYVPGHIDIAVIDKDTGENISIISTDFDSHIARHGRYNLKHANNIGTRLPGIDPKKSTVVVAYHYSNVDRFSKRDCGANVALASINDKNTSTDATADSSSN